VYLLSEDLDELTSIPAGLV